jgi:hypothetical protein
MSVPTDYIFTPGTCFKKDFYDVLCNALIGAGWKNITSNYATDGDVFTSTGNTSDKALLINLQKFYGTYSPIDISVHNWIGVRLPTSYTPGSVATAGTFISPPWVGLSVVPQYEYERNNTAGPLDTMFDYKIYVDKSKLLFSVEYPSSIDKQPLFAYIGLPDSTYTSESDNRGSVLGFTSGTNGYFLVANTPDGVGSVTSYDSLYTISNIPSKNPNNSGNYGISEIYYGSSSEGIRGKLDGVLALPNINIKTGNLIKIGSSTYYVLVCHSCKCNSFPSLALAIRIS